MNGEEGVGVVSKWIGRNIYGRFRDIELGGYVIYKILSGGFT